jgi:hypothetical protein
VRRPASSNLLHHHIQHHCRDDDLFFPQNIDPDYHESSRLLASTVLIEPDRQHTSSHFAFLIFCMFNGCSRPSLCMCGRGMKDAVQDTARFRPIFYPKDKRSLSFFSA